MPPLRLSSPLFIFQFKIMKKTPYEDLPVIPHLVAEMVCKRTYQGKELSDQSNFQVAMIEKLRKEMTPEQVRIFSNWCDRRCKAAYEAEALWFTKCYETDNSINQLYYWISHWLAAYLINPEIVEITV